MLIFRNQYRNAKVLKSSVLYMHHLSVFAGRKGNFIMIIISDSRSLVTHQLCKQWPHTFVNSDAK